MEDVETMHVRPLSRPLSLVQLLLLNSIVCGLEFCASAAFTYIPPMLLKAGLQEEHMSIVLGVGPLLGFFLVPIIGHSSDRCRNRYGRRRPFILGISLMLLLSLLIIPYGELFGVYAFGGGGSSKGLGVTLLIVGAVMLDFSSQACLTPCEALLSDACKTTGQQDRCFTVYSFMVSMGGCIGYLITALDWSSNSVGIYFGGQEQSAFSVLILLFTFTMCTTLAVAQEVPLSAQAQQSDNSSVDVHNKLDQIHRAIIRQKQSNGVPGMAVQDPGYESDSNHSEEVNAHASYQAEYEITDVATRERKDGINLFREKNCNIPLTKWSFTHFDVFVRWIILRLSMWLPQGIRTLFAAPFVLKRLAVANFFSWIAIMGFNLFFTDFVGQAVYGGNPNAPENSEERALYDAGVRMGSWGLLLHCITSAIFAVFVEKLVRRYGSRETYFIGMFIFTIAMSVMVFFRNVVIVALMAACTGFAYATVTTIPFMLITLYHQDKEVFFCDVSHEEQLRGTGTDMATLDSSYFLAQVVLSAIMGYMVRWSGTVLTYIVFACGTGAVSCTLIFRIVFCKKQITDFMMASKRQLP